MAVAKNKKITAEEYTQQFLKSNKEYHLNFETAAETYQVSSGSMLADVSFDGGFYAGLLRFCGANEGGKTSAALEVMRNFFIVNKDGKGVWIPAEGRLSEQMKFRSGIKFVDNTEEWIDGTCLLFESNVYDVIFDYLRGLLKNNPERKKFCIGIDSMDGLISKNDLEKNTSEANKVAAGALMTSDFLKRVSLGMAKFGHLCIMLSQVRSAIKLNQYERGDMNNQTNSSGGNAALHYPDWILEFMRPYAADYILQDPTKKPSDENKKIGHYARVKICKSSNESTSQIIRYPIKYGRVGGRSIWVEREVVDLLLMWEHIEKKSSWFSFDEELDEFLKSKGFGVKTPIQGLDKIYKLLEDDSDLTLAFQEFARKNIIT